MLTPQRGASPGLSRASGPRLLSFRVLASQSSLRSVCSWGSKAPSPLPPFFYTSPSPSLHATTMWHLPKMDLRSSEKKPWSQDPSVLSHWATQHLNPGTHISTLRNPSYHANSLSGDFVIPQCKLALLTVEEAEGSGRVSQRSLALGPGYWDGEARADQQEPGGAQRRNTA